MISIVMPVFNGEDYVDRAVRSIQNQTFKDWELIAIDDGSDDNSAEILERYSFEDARIRIIHKKNEGVSIARQEGVDASKGEYIIHFDCDDWAEETLLEELYSIAKKEDADLVWCNYYREEDQTIKCSTEGPEDSFSLIKLLLKGQIWGTIWNQLIRASICKKTTVSFPRECICWEDLAFLINVLLECENVKHCDKYLYHYNMMNVSSITHSQNFPRLIENGYIKAISHIENSLRRSKHESDFQFELIGRKLTVLRYYIDCGEVQNFEKFINTYPEAILRINEYKEYPQRIKQCAWLLSHRCAFAVPALLKIHSLFRKIGFVSAGYSCS